MFLRVNSWAAAAVLSLTPLLGFGYDIHMDSSNLKDRLQQLDCSVDTAECRYYAVAETVAYFDACPAVIVQKFRQTLPEKDLRQIDEMLQKWNVFNDAALKAAVFNPENKVVAELKKVIRDYLQRSPVDDVGIECSRIGSVKEQQPPEDMSDLLQATKNYESWIQKRKNLTRLPY